MRYTILLFLLASCAPTRPPYDPTAIPRMAEKIRQDCSTEPTHLAQEKCANPNILVLYTANGAIPVDIMTAYLARREAIAEKMDTHVISETEGNAEMKEAAVNGNNLLRQRQPPKITCFTSEGITTCH